MILDLGFYTKQLQRLMVSYTGKDGQRKEAFGKYFGQSSFSNRMAVTDRSVSKERASLRVPNTILPLLIS